jgi:hypothetical protein
MKLVAIAFQLILFSTATGLSHPLAQKEGRFSVAGLDDDREVEQFFISFKEAIAKADKKKVASLVSYPIKVNLASGRWTKIRNAADFIRTYDRIFDDQFKRLILRTDVKDLWAKSSGVAMPSGEIWFNGIVKDANHLKKYTIRITTINGPIRSLGVSEKCPPRSSPSLRKAIAPDGSFC